MFSLGEIFKEFVKCLNCNRGSMVLNNDIVLLWKVGEKQSFSTHGYPTFVWIELSLFEHRLFGRRSIGDEFKEGGIDNQLLKGKKYTKPQLSFLIYSGSQQKAPIFKHTEAFVVTSGCVSVCCSDECIAPESSTPASSPVVRVRQTGKV